MITLLLCLIVTIPLNGILAIPGYTKVVTNLPKAKNINNYLAPLERILQFCVKHKVYIDLNFEFGLFLVNVNLKNIFQAKAEELPPQIKYRLEELLIKTDVVNSYFRYMVKKTEENIAYGQDRRISRLLTNETFWMKYVQRYNLKLFEKSKIYTMEQLENIYGDWDVYESNVRNYEKYKPSPDDSDACIALLGDHPIAEGSANVETICKTPKSCRDGASNGNDFGYFLTHRVLFLLLAQFARGCSIFSVKEDKDKLEKYCGIIFNEAQFIATHDYKRPDLFMEQIAICTLLGHAQFLQDDWMKPLMALQTSSGCFTDNWRIVGENELPMVELPGDEWMLSNNIVMNRACSGHTTAVAAAMLASAIRYIVENNYSSAT